MLAFPMMIAPAAEKAGIKVPLDLEKFDPAEYPHWQVFCRMQLGAPMPYASAHWDNAKVIAALDNEEILRVTSEQLQAKGFSIGFSH